LGQQICKPPGLALIFRRPILQEKAEEMMRARLFGLAGLILFSSLPAIAAESPLARMEQVIQSNVADKRFMGAVLLVRDDKVVLDKGFGSADLEWNVPNTPATKFRLGSVTKQFTAASILLLEERGSLKTTDPVRKYLPELPESWDKITIFNLLTHSSGIFNMTALPDFKDFKRRHLTPRQMVDLVRDKPLDFQPGEKFNYSNTGYIVLGMVIEKVGGQPYAQFLQANIFTPLGMKDSGYEDQAAILPLRAQGYQRTSAGALTNADFIDMSVPFAAGALYSTTHDLLTWERALFGGKLLSAASFTKMTTPFKDNYAFGLGVTNSGGHQQIAHNGGIEGFSTIIVNYPDDRLIVIVLDNIATGAPGDIASKLADIAFGKTVTLISERKEAPGDPKILARYVGHYQLAPNVVADITQEGNFLYFQPGKQPKAQMFAEGPKDFFLKIVDAQATFVADGDGPASALIWHQGGRDMTAPRVP
jgi:CubicO group peptidase (beta-lactamase class C family)